MAALLLPPTLPLPLPDPGAHSVVAAGAVAAAVAAVAAAAAAAVAVLLAAMEAAGGRCWGHPCKTSSHIPPLSALYHSAKKQLSRQNRQRAPPRMNDWAGWGLWPELMASLLAENALRQHQMSQNNLCTQAASHTRTPHKPLLRQQSFFQKVASVLQPSESLPKALVCSAGPLVLVVRGFKFASPHPRCRLGGVFSIQLLAKHSSGEGQQQQQQQGLGGGEAWVAAYAR
jgi:hypothetical protein